MIEAGGSPPRARGEVVAEIIHAEIEGITPACAGRSFQNCLAQLFPVDHPRVRGEKCSLLEGTGNRRGSPPRARGEESRISLMLMSERITPACAGRSVCGFPALIANRDHPRVRGEKSAWLACATTRRGSPPRARGEARPCRYCARPRRITPACAGRRILIENISFPVKDHPRVRGEKGDAVMMQKLRSGSPPRARGEAVQFRRLDVSDGITPACAGRRAGVSKSTVTVWGSPPRARGEVRVYLARIRKHRITPACAGRSTKRFIAADCEKDHPRVRGEKLESHQSVDTVQGSPPRARGEVALFGGLSDSGGITPACAGRSCWTGWKKSA